MKSTSPRFTRRSFAVLASSLVAVGTARGANVRPASAHPKTYSSSTAPDAISRQILAQPIASLRPRRGQDPAWSVHQNFARVIDQNFARAQPAAVSAWLKQASPIELSRLSSRYIQSSQNSSHTPLLGKILASRLPPGQLVRLSPYLGFGPLYEGLLSVRPASAADFLRAQESASRSSLLAAVPQPSTVTASVGMLEYTLEEIYLSYRTAPVGSLGVRAAMYETATFAGKHLTIAYGVGYTVGTGLAAVMQIFTPSLYDALGQSLYEFVQSIHEAPTWQDMGDALYHGAGLFQVEPVTYDSFAFSGGDYGITMEWAWQNGGFCYDTSFCDISL